MLSSLRLRNVKRSAPAARQRTQTSLRQPASLRPYLEGLEDRCLFSTLTVTSLQDSGAGSLRATITAAQSGDTIVFSPTLFSSTTTSTSNKTPSAPLLSKSAKGTNNGKGHGNPTSPPPPPPPPPVPTITLTTGELLLDKDLTVQGPGAGKLVISGGLSSRAFEVAQGSTVVLSGVAISGSSSYWTSYPVVTAWSGYGGGILNHGSLTVSACTISGVVYGYAQGGGIFSDGTLSVIGCTVTNSRAESGDTSGGGISNWGAATFTNSIISNNAAEPPSSLSYPWFNKGGGIFNQGTMTFNGCTVSGNRARRAGGGIFNTGTLMLNGSTVSGNGSDYGGGIYNAGTMTLTNYSSITGNSDAHPGDVDNVGVLNLDDTSTIGILYSGVAILDFSDQA